MGGKILQPILLYKYRPATKFAHFQELKGGKREGTAAELIPFCSFLWLHSVYFPCIHFKLSFPAYSRSMCHLLKADNFQLSFTHTKEKDLILGPSIMYLDAEPCWPLAEALCIENTGASKHQLLPLQSLYFCFYQNRQQGIYLTCILKMEDGKILMFHCLHV